MSKSKFMHTLLESKSTFSIEQKAIVSCFVKMLGFYWYFFISELHRLSLSLVPFFYLNVETVYSESVPIFFLYDF